jgi:hypothetical protein
LSHPFGVGNSDGTGCPILTWNNSRIVGSAPHKSTQEMFYQCYGIRPSFQDKPCPEGFDLLEKKFKNKWRRAHTFGQVKLVIAAICFKVESFFCSLILVLFMFIV